MAVHKKPTAADLDRMVSEQLGPTDTQRTTDAQATDSVLTTDTQQGETPRRQIRIPDTDWDRLNSAAAGRSISASALVRQILREWLGR